MRTLVVLLAIAGASWGVTQEQIAAQRAVVEREQTCLDSLLSLAKAEVLQDELVKDALLTETRVAVTVVTPALATGLRDPLYVNVDIPYSKWDGLTQREWNLKLNESGIGAIPVSMGLYSVHVKEVQALLALVKVFIIEHTGD